jgi:hypothetical protein
LNLYDAFGNLVATATGNASDGRNDVIDWTALSSGSYRMQVASATSGGFGEYTLSVQGATGGLYPLGVASSTPPSGAKLTHAPATVTVSLDHSVRLDSVSAGDFVIDGQSATGFTITNDHTIVFAIPALSPGAHNASVSGLVDVQGLPVTPYGFGFSTVK